MQNGHKSARLFSYKHLGVVAKTVVLQTGCSQQVCDTRCVARLVTQEKAALVIVTVARGVATPTTTPTVKTAADYQGEITKRPKATAHLGAAPNEPVRGPWSP